MPTLNWIGKEKVINHHQDVPFRVLEEQYSCGAPDGNKIIHGDNLDALKALLPQYEGKVQLIYIDPPYNTGNEKWIYNDNVNDPKIKKWLGEVVGKEGEDLSRHDKWLCMMYPRLKLLQRILSDDGVMVVSIGYHELFNLVSLLKEIFSTYQIVPVTVQTSGGKPSAGFNYVQEYLIFITPDGFSPKPTSFAGGNKTSPFHGMNLATFTQSQRPNQTYPIFIEEQTGEIVGHGLSLADRVKRGSYTGELQDFVFDYAEAPEGCIAIWPVSNKGIPCVWRLIAPRLMSDKSKGYIRVLKQNPNKNKNVFSVQYLSGGMIEKIENGKIQIVGREASNHTVILGEYTSEGATIPTIWFEKDFYTVNGNNQLLSIFDCKSFSYPKPVQLIEEIVRATTNLNAIILDSFAGSGTTAHAVLNMNKQDGGNRKFILVEMEDYAEHITAERVRRVIDGYGEGKNAVEGTGGGFTYYNLGKPLLFADGNLNESVGEEKIRDYVWYMETKLSVPENKADEPYYLGETADTAYYFYYKKEEITTLGRDFLKTIKTRMEGYIIYADKCGLSPEELKQYGITFKKIPRDIAKL